MPCYACEHTVADTLSALLAQEDAPTLRIIAADNGSPDGTRAVLDAWASRAEGAIRVIDARRPGSYAARNAGLEAAEAEIVLFLDADAVPDPGWVRALYDRLADPQVLYVAAEVRAHEPATLLERYADDAGLLRQDAVFRGRRRRFLQTLNLGVRRRQALEIGGFDGSLLTGGDADFCWRLEDRFPGLEPMLLDAMLVAHRHRSTWAGLWRQFARYGEGDRVLARLHPGSRSPMGKKVALDLLRCVLAPVLAVAGCPAALARRSWLPMAAPFVRAFTILARWRGSLGAGGVSRRRI